MFENQVTNQPIYAGSDYANELGFTDDLFEGYIWDEGNGAIYISFVKSLNPGRGNFSAFVRGLINHGLTVKVPAPIGDMRNILEHLKFKKTLVPDNAIGEVAEVWISPNAILSLSDLGLFPAYPTGKEKENFDTIKEYMERKLLGVEQDCDGVISFALHTTATKIREAVSSPE